MPRAPKSSSPKAAETTRRPRAAVVARSGPSHETIAERAYELFVLNGTQHGLDIEHWITAEQELLSASARPVLPFKQSARRA